MEGESPKDLLDFDFSKEEMENVKNELDLDKDGIPVLEDESIQHLNQHKIPDYLVDVYTWAYENLKI